MQLLALWKDSLRIFYPLDNFKLFGLAVARAVQVAVSHFLKLFWMVPFSIIFFGILLQVFNPNPIIFFPIIAVVAILSPWVELFFVMFFALVVRPSVSQKTYIYLKKMTPFVGKMFFLSFPLLILVFALERSHLIGYSGWIFLDKIFFIFYFCGLLPIHCFFFFDSRGSFEDWFFSAKQAFKMMSSVFPLMIITFLSLWLMPYFFGLIQLMIVFFLVCFWSVLYTKQIHEHYEFYFPGPQAKE